MPGNHVDDRSGDKKRRYPAWPAVDQFCVCGLDHRQSTDTRANHAPDAGGFLFTQRLAGWQSGIRHRLGRGRDTEMDKCIHGPGILGTKVGVEIETLDLAGDPASEAGSIKAGNQTDAGSARKQVRPSIRNRVAYGTDTTQTGYDNATTGHGNLYSTIMDGRYRRQGAGHGYGACTTRPNQHCRRKTRYNISP